VEFVNLAEGRDNENAISAFLTRHKFGVRLIHLILDKHGIDPKVRKPALLVLKRES
jgi:hypothetical protein